MFESRFKTIRKNIVSDLDFKKISVRDILQSLRMLPIELQPEYERAISKKLPDLREEKEAGDLFLFHLNPLVNFIDYHLVEYIIKEFGCNTLKIEIRSYADDIDVFMRETTVKELIEHCKWPGKQKKSPEFSKLIAKIDGNQAKYTLYELNELRRRFCGGVKMTEIVFVLIGLESSNSFLAMWMFPSCLVTRLMDAAKSLDFEFYRRLHILKVTVDDEQIFPYLASCKSKVPACRSKC